MFLRVDKLCSLAGMALFAVALSGCGGGGGGGLRPANFETPEYNQQAGLRLINASSIYARGGIGKGITVAVFDSGASSNHPALAGKYVYTGGMSGTDGVDGTGGRPDEYGHGTHVTGIIAAKRDGSEMHGVAYEANIASYELDYDHTAFDAQLAVGIDEMSARGVYLTNNSWGSDRSVLDVTLSQLESQSPLSIAAYKTYVADGGVQIWAAGNDNRAEVSVEAGAPHLISELEKGWLAVAAIDLYGNEASYTNRCGVAAAWCLAAPGGDFPSLGGAPGSVGVYSTYIDTDGYERLAGTSMAAPHVTGALAALKSRFSNLSYQDLRNRILVTADDSGIYADETIYGQGLLDLDAASRPVGGTSFALGTYDAGAVVSTAGASVNLPSGAISRYLAGRNVLILDNYQRAPFLVPLNAFAGARGGYLSMSDLGLETPERNWDDQGEDVTLAIAGDGFRVHGASNGAWLSGMGHGSRVMEGMAHLVGVPLPHGDYRMADDALGVTLGFVSEIGEAYMSAATGSAADRTTAAGFGIVGWSPETVLAASFVPSGAVESFGASVTSKLKTPMGWAGAGALEMSGDSLELAYSRNLVAGETYRLGVASRLAYLATETSPLVEFDDALLATTELNLSHRLGRGTTLNARLGIERSVTSSNGSIRAATSIDENGRIAYDDISIDGSKLLAFDKVGVSVRHAWGPNTNLGVSVAAVRDGFGETEALAGARAEIRF